MRLTVNRPVTGSYFNMTFHCTLSRSRLLGLALWVSGFWIWLTIIRSPLSLNHSRYPAWRDVLSQGNEEASVTFKEHPIKKHVLAAEAEFEEMLARQSKTYEAAASEYLQRYHRDPPPGFEMWYDFAVRHKSLIIDEFDIINETLSPFWKLGGAELRRRLDDVRENGWAIQSCESKAGRLDEGCESLGEGTLLWLQNPVLSTHLPDVELFINVLDEPRVLSKVVDSDSELSSDQMNDWSDDSRAHVWDKLTAACNFRFASEATGNLTPDRDVQAAAIRFSDGKQSHLDLCKHPEYDRMHGLWNSASNLHTTHLAVPILSTGVLSTMGDIPYPAPAYTRDDYTYDETEDLHWEDKVPGLYWAGKTTGGISNVLDQDWGQYHRERFVTLVNSLASEPHSYLETTDNGKTWHQHSAYVVNGPQYKVHFTEIVQYADETTYDAISDAFDIHEPDPRAEAFRYTLAFDLDGNGHSGRFYRLLNSHSLPLKQTVMREWHDERLQPWLHYVPISLDMNELPEVVRYLSEEEEGRQAAAFMAEKGREWSLRVLRPVDQALYVYRLMLELARVQDAERPASM